VGAKSAWLNMEQWNKCADPSLKIEDFKGEPCVVGLDLATRIDVAAAVQVFYREEDDGLTHYYAFPKLWLPEHALESSRNAQRYMGWAGMGLIDLIDGAEIDLNGIQDWLVGDPNDDETGLASQYYIAEVAYDPWQASQLAQTASAQGARVVEFRNIVSNMSPAMKELEGAIQSGRFHFDGNPALTWMASNVVAKLDAKDNIYPVKEQPENKIDGIVALIMAIGRAYYAQESRSAYESESLMVV
jgi:phage terminase large subunit-like protein